MSFSDMMSSARGPGLIGTLLAMVVVVGFGLLFMIASDEGPLGESQAIGAVITRQGKSIESLRGNIAAGEKLLEQVPVKVANAKELARLNRAKSLVQTRITELNSRLTSCREEITHGDEIFEAYKNEYRAFVRGKAKGETFDKLEMPSGVIYHKVSIGEVTAIGIQLRHEGGFKRIPFEELSEALQDRFQYDPKQKQAAMTEEAEYHARYDLEVDVADGIAGQKKDEQRQKDAVLAKEQLRQDIDTKEAKIQAVAMELQDLTVELSRKAASANAARAAGRIYLDESNRVSGSIRLKRTQIANLQAEVRQMKYKLKGL